VEGARKEFERASRLRSNGRPSIAGLLALANLHFNQRNYKEALELWVPPGLLPKRSSAAQAPSPHTAPPTPRLGTHPQVPPCAERVPRLPSRRAAGAGRLLLQAGQHVQGRRSIRACAGAGAGLHAGSALASMQSICSLACMKVYAVKGLTIIAYLDWLGGLVYRSGWLMGVGVGVRAFVLGGLLACLA
jgi:hypothetical protein